MYKLKKCWLTLKIHLGKNNLSAYNKIINYMHKKKSILFFNYFIKYITFLINEKNINFVKKKNMLYLNLKVKKILKKW